MVIFFVKGFFSCILNNNNTFQIVGPYMDHAGHLILSSFTDVDYIRLTLQTLLDIPGPSTGPVAGDLLKKKVIQGSSLSILINFHKLIS